MNRKSLLLSAIALSILLLGIAGCQSTATFYQGKLVAPEDVIPIPGGVENELWSTSDLTLRYGYQENGNNFHITGQVDIADQYSEIYNKLSRLDIYLVFLDHNSRVLATAVLLRNQTYTFDENISFDAQIIIPPGAVAFSFAYDGTALEFEKRSIPISFWHHPK